ncbi:MAG: TrbG/VirB9 family P-type conjugative transfer protein [Acidobacteria bacterium]|nr:TrbG/VirB9 family P-type conjugative transfer protein [Acidobacteriota bacterium]
MRRCWILTIFFIAAAATQLRAQKIDRETSDPSQIIHLRTALNHLTVIELREPVLQVAAGSQSFKVEWRENKVFVQPTEPDASTNLFVWTASRRLNYELELAGSVATMDFAIDQAPPVQPKPLSVSPKEPSPTEVLLSGQPVRLESGKPSARSVEVAIRDLYERDGRLLVRYAVRNNSAHTYEVTTPSVYVLPGVRYPQSLYGLVDSQLGDREASRLEIKAQSPVPVIEGHVQSSHLEPGQQCLGLVALHVPSAKEPMVLRFQFANDGREQVAAFLVR